jgi:methyl-accepting chemotaxis protein
LIPKSKSPSLFGGHIAGFFRVKVKLFRQKGFKSMNRSFSLNAKLLMLCVFLLSISLVVGALSYWSFEEVSNSYDFVLEKVVPKTKLSYEMMLRYRRVRIELRTLGLQGISPEESEKSVKQALEAIENYEKKNDEYVNLGFIPGQKEVYDKVHMAWLDFKAVGERVISLEKSGKPEDRASILKIFLNDCPEKAIIYTAAVENLIQFHQKTLENKKVEAKAIVRSGNQMSLLVILAGLTLGLGIGFFIARKVTRAVGSVSKDLAFGSEQVAQASSQIAGSSQSLSESATEQASSLEETVATMEELTSMVRLNTENGKQAASLAVSTREIAIKGEQEIKTLIESIHSISADSRKIEEITNVIDDIAFQTNLLALNAAVEAARAGEQGRGFAVVAEAVRGLALRSSVAAKDIAELIKNSVEKIELGSKQANQGGVVLSEIVTAVRKVADLNNEIATASEEQSNGIIQIGKAMNQMDQVTQQNAAAAEETAAAAEELSGQSESLKVNVTSLEKEIYGSRHVHGPEGSSLRPPIEKKSKPVLAAGKVLKFKKIPDAVNKNIASPSNVIPFNEDEFSLSRKVGNIDGF